MIKKIKFQYLGRIFFDHGAVAATSDGKDEVNLPGRKIPRKISPSACGAARKIHEDRENLVDGRKSGRGMENPQTGRKHPERGSQGRRSQEKRVSARWNP